MATLSITAWPTKQPLKQHAGHALQNWHAPGTQQQQKPLKNEQPTTALPGERSGGSSESAWGHETGEGSAWQRAHPFCTAQHVILAFSMISSLSMPNFLLSICSTVGTVDMAAA